MKKISIFWFIVSLFISNLNDLLTKYLTLNYNIFDITFYRYFFSSIILIPFIIKFYNRKFIVVNYTLHISRSILLFIGITLWNFEINVIEINIITLVNYTIPIFAIILSIIFLKERVDKKFWVIAIIGMIGAIIAINPQLINFKIYFLIFIAAAFIFAILDITNKYLLEKENVLQIMFFTNFLVTIISLPIASFHLNIYSIDCLLFIILGIGNILMVYFILKAFANLEVSYLEIFRYVEIIFSAVMGYLLFNEIPKINFYYGAFLILFANLYLLFFKKLIITQCAKL